MAILLALSFLTIFQMLHLSSAAPGGFFRFQRFSAAELRQNLGLDSLKLDEREFTNAAAELVVAADESRNHELSLFAGNRSTVPASHPNANALRGVRKLLFGTLSCAPQDLSLTQGPVSSTSGIPTFNVQIVNLCGACAMADIHVACGNWASATPVDPFVFTRLGYNDCLVNNGQPLSSQGSVSFQYSNSAMYPMSIATATNECSR
ncbi:hypothetical protein Mapa_013104 [Marchantia paleacea]|nr:hypothetical protein Mapa_013104 [Marchantia paleacea]